MQSSSTAPGMGHRQAGGRRSPCIWSGAMRLPTPRLSTGACMAKQGSMLRGYSNLPYIYPPCILAFFVSCLGVFLGDTGLQETTSITHFTYRLKAHTRRFASAWRGF